MTATIARDRAIRIIALRVAADLLENPPDPISDQGVPLRQFVFYTADDQETFDLDLFDDPTLDAITDRVRDLIEAKS